MWRGVLEVFFPAQCAACAAFGSGFCAQCGPPAGGLRGAVAGLEVSAYGEYAGALRAAILALKDGRRDVARALGERIAPSIARGSILVPVPTTRARLRVRGMDGVALVAGRAAELAQARVVAALSQRAGDAQRGRTRRERLAARNRFAADAARVRGSCVTLVDDVCTTGATLRDCATALRDAGAGVVGAVVVAMTNAASPWRLDPPRG